MRPSLLDTKSIFSLFWFSSIDVHLRLAFPSLLRLVSFFYFYVSKYYLYLWIFVKFMWYFLWVNFGYFYRKLLLDMFALSESCICFGFYNFQFSEHDYTRLWFYIGLLSYADVSLLPYVNERHGFTIWCVRVSVPTLIE